MHLITGVWLFYYIKKIPLAWYNLMNIVKVFEIRIYPTESQQALIKQFFGASRFVYNTILSEIKENYFKSGEIKSHLKLRDIKHDNEWLEEIPSNILKDTITQLTDQIKKLSNLNKQGESIQLPDFRSKRDKNQYYTFPMSSQFKVLEDYLNIPLVGMIKREDSTLIEGKIESITISKSAYDYKAIISAIIKKQPLTSE
jgi:putative transposase